MPNTQNGSGDIEAKPNAYVERIADGVSAITLNRPKQKNAISVKLLGELKASIEQAADDQRRVSFECHSSSNLQTDLVLNRYAFQRCSNNSSGRAKPSLRVLIIRSSERGSFCAGADLAERRTMSPAAVSLFLQNLRSTFTLLQNFHMPTIAAIDGPCLGGGLELSLACDFRVAGSQAKKIGLPETKLGIIPGAGGTQRATRLLGITKAKELVFTGRMMDADAALAFGTYHL